MRPKRQPLRTICAIGTLLTFTTVACHADDWPQFRGPYNNSVSGAQALPVEWTLDDVAWSIALPGRCVSGPVVTGDRVITSSSSGRQNDRLHVFCVDARTGELAWKRQLWATGRTFCHPLTSMASPTPATDGTRIYVLFASNDLVCFDLEGNVLWMRAIGIEHPQTFDDRGLGSSPLLVGDTLVLQFECSGDSFATGIACRDGKTRWRRTLPHSINWLSPATLKLEDQALALLQTTDQLLVLEPKNGEVVSSYPIRGTAIASPVARDEVVFMPAGGLTAVKFDPTADKLQFLWQENRLGAQRGSPVVTRGRVYVVRSSNVLVCGDAETGESLWSLRLKGSQFWTTPIVAGKYLYAASAEGLVQVVDISGEEPEIVARNDMQEEMLGSPAVADGAIYLRGVEHLWKVGPDATHFRSE
jgi:outer membrane protein assembly factor BamB